MNVNNLDEANYDSVILSIGREWLAQYARFLRRSPELVERLADRLDEFELIPIPKVLLNRLAVPGIVGSGTLGDIESEIPRLLEFDATAMSQKLGIFSREAAFNRIREFTAAIAAGDATRASALFSSRFINPDGKNAVEIFETMGRLFDHAYVRRFNVLSIEETHGSDVEVVARVKATWSAAGKEEFMDSVFEAVCLEIVLERQSDGDWKISAVRSV